MKFRNKTGKILVFCGILLLGLLGGCYVTETVKAAEATGGEKTEAAVADQTKAAGADLYLLRVRTNQDVKYGYMDADGNVVIQPVYSDARDFSEGFAVVYNGEKYQVIDKNKKVIFETNGMIQDFHDGMASFSDPDNNYRQGYINTKGKIVLKAKYGYTGAFGSDHTAVVTLSEKLCRINKKGKVVKTYQPESKYSFNNIEEDGYLVYMDQKTFLKGVVTLEGKEIMKPVYGEITYLGNDLFGVKKALPEEERYLLSIKPSALFDKNGKRLTAYKYCDLSAFHEGYASATDSSKTYLIDLSGKKAASLPAVEGRGTMIVKGDLVQADIDYEMSYLKKDGSVVWKQDGMTQLSTGASVQTLILRPNKYVSVRYPQLEGMNDTKVQAAINQKLSKIFTDHRRDLKESDLMCVTDKFTVEQRNDLLIIQATGYDYPIGAAHGIPLRFYYFINLKTGTFYQLKDLFLSKSDYVAKLSQIVYQQMQKQSKNGEDVYYFDSKDLINKNQYFYINGDKLILYFDSGAISSYAAGFPEFEIPFDDIKSLINTQGAFWKAFHS